MKTAHATQQDTFIRAANTIIMNLSGSNRTNASTTVLAHTLKLLSSKWGFERAYNHVRTSLGVS